MANSASFDISRRDLLIVGAAAAASSAVPAIARAQQSGPLAVAASASGPVATDVGLTINGTAQRFVADNRLTLLDALRETLQLTGTKKGCDHGQCGACTVMVNGRRINACLTLAIMHEGDEVTTIEGFGDPENLHSMQAAFIRHDGYQCGYCTPGQICSANAVLDEIRAGVPSHVTADLTADLRPTADEIRERMSGNICRCGAYANILAAITDVSENSA